MSTTARSIAPAGKPGRPTKLTVETRARLVEAIGRGVPAKFACAGCRISFQAFSNWREKFEDFREELAEAQARAMEKYLRVIERAAETDPRFACWQLEHRWPEHFAKSRLEISTPNGEPLAQVAIFLPQKDSAEPLLVAGERQQIEAHQPTKGAT